MKLKAVLWGCGENLELRSVTANAQAIRTEPAAFLPLTITRHPTLSPGEGEGEVSGSSAQQLQMSRWLCESIPSATPYTHDSLEFWEERTGGGTRLA